MGKIRINNLKYYTYNGCLNHENEFGQPIEVDIEMSLDLSKAGQSDRVEDTINYAVVNDLIRNHVGNNSYNLIETLAYNILDVIENEFKDQLNGLLIRVRKYSVPMAGIYDNIEIEMEREIT